MSDKSVQLEKSLSPASVWAMAVGSIIGWGCFVLPPDMLSKGGPLGASLAIIIGAIIMIVIANSIGLLVKLFPVAGGAFTYAYKGFGRTHAYICGWFLALGYLSIVPLNATALAIMAKFTAPDLFTKGYLYTVAGFDVYIGELILASAVIIIFAALNMRGVKEVGQLQLVMVGLLCGAVFLIGGGAALSPVSSLSNLTPVFMPGQSIFASIIPILVIAPLLYVGFDTIPQSAEESNFSPSQSKFLIITSILAGGGMYIIALFATGVVFPWQETVAAGHVWATGYTTQVALGKFGYAFLLSAVTMGILTGINGFYMATSRLLLSMARAKILPAWFGKLSPKSNTPSNGILFIAGVSLLAPWFGRQVISWVVDMASLGIGLGFLYTCLTAYVICKSTPTMDAKEAATGKVQAIIGSFLSLTIIGFLVVPASPGAITLPSWIALAGWTVIGLVFYALRRKEYNALSKAELDKLIFGSMSNGDDDTPKNTNLSANPKTV
ncbi:amino acid/polyamine/organocation transporter, APC superfamily [Desulfonispora thiosulfatigenes DSM 11270]|uniref:Amino acid/polyamine/organocation transporter, APC superfamily n=1 Tax=Desulfonispora thiosulfatigenes DSM 11270 TaxID=656914 RepID=A0A1W1UWB6_DESTI|nr:APC family permease [Desulfonispora thiosulfatigenes]SMB85289.1 amino acid/polyamine/organocation transporter, APC superfamily [Desulfonispora thiosulfatigenes DSM 11270]